MSELSEYLESRRKTIEASIAAEKLAGNSVKEQCERTALAEITAIEANVNTRNEWIPVSERLPDDSKEVLIYYRHDDGSHNIDTDQYGELGWSFYRDENVTHWMPLPAPPKEPETERRVKYPDDFW